MTNIPPPQIPPRSQPLPPPAPMDGISIASLVTSILGMCVPLLGLIGIGLGAAGITRTAGGRRRGRGLAIAGLAVGVVSLVFLVIQISILLPTLSKVRESGNRAKCASHLRTIGQSIRAYASQNQGNYPPSIVELHRASGFAAGVLCCPSSDQSPSSTVAATDELARKMGHLSYIYLGAGLVDTPRQPVSSERPIVLEIPTNHNGDGYNILFGDGHIDFLSAPAARRMLEQLAAEGAISPADIPTLMPQRR